MENELDPAVVVPPWLDLPTHLAEEILERLPLSGYVRFAAVCRQWRSIQSAHRRRHAPSPPPMRSLPWFIPWFDLEESVSCYSPMEDRSYVVRLPSTNGPSRYPYLFNRQGWLLAHDSGHLALFNPISATKVVLPPGKIAPELSQMCLVSSPPNYVISVMLSPFSVSLLRWCDRAWSVLTLPVSPRDARRSPQRAISCGGKHYYIFRGGRPSAVPVAENLLVVDPLPPAPTIQFFKMMRWGKRRRGGAEGTYGTTHLVEFDGELLLVKEIIRSREKGSCSLKLNIIGYHLFRADLCKNMWVRVESLGDRVLFVHQNNLVSLLAADVGLKRNCIYFNTWMMIDIDSREAPWKVFDLGTETVADVLLPNATHVEECCQYIFVPSIC